MQTFLTIDGISQGNMIMQSHDIVYITPNFNLGSEIIQDINSVFSFISTISLVWLTISQINPIMNPQDFQQTEEIFKDTRKIFQA